MKINLVLLSCYWLSFEYCSSYRILFIPIQQMSHIDCMVLIGQELSRRGHDSYIMLMEKFKPDKLRLSSNTSAGLAGINWFDAATETYDGRPVEIHMEEFSEKLLKFSHSSRDLADIVVKRHSDYCENKLKRIAASFDELVKLKLDLVVVDVAVFSKCFLLVPYRLGIPYVTYTDYPDPLSMRLPWLPSIVPHHFSRYSDKMSIFQRVTNAVITLVTPLLMPDFPVSKEVRQKYDPNLKIDSFDELTRESKLIMLTSNPVLDYAKPLMPNTVQIGGVTTRPAKPLPEWLKNFLEETPSDGIILVSLGSMFSTIPLEMIDRFSEAFHKLPDFRILWRLKNSHNVSFSGNVLTSEWLPQVDILGHPRTRLFITHCGNNGQFEALYHKVPMLGMPIFGDQHYNAQRIHNKGFGLVMDISSFTSSDLLSNIHRIIHDPGFKSRISRASELFRDSPESPARLAARCLERVVKHDSEYFLSPGISLDLYEYWMIDIIIVLFGLVILTSLAATAVAIFCVRLTRKCLNSFKVNRGHVTGKHLLSIVGQGKKKI